MTHSEERRRHPRCRRQEDIVFTYGRQAKFQSGRVKNYSRSSLYFESPAELAAGTLLFIRAADDDSEDLPAAGDADSAAASAAAADPDPVSAACREWKTLVVGQVRRCEKIAGSGKALYGTGVEYVSPAV